MYLHTPQEVGELTERMLIDSVSYNKPDWLVKLERASTFLDVRGIDAIAHVTYTDGRKGRIPIQVRSSENGKIEFYQQYKWAVDWNVPCIVVRLRYHQVTTLLLLIEELQWRRNQDVWYERLVEGRSSYALNTFELSQQKELEERRRWKITNRYKTNNPPWWNKLCVWWLCL